jgi:hypothetical protein
MEGNESEHAPGEVVAAMFIQTLSHSNNYPSVVASVVNSTGKQSHTH